MSSYSLPLRCSQLLAAVSLFLLVGVRYAQPAWTLDREPIAVGIGFACAFLVLLASGAHGNASGGTAPALAGVLRLTLLAVVPVSLVVLLSDYPMARSVLIAEAGLLVIFVGANLASRTPRLPIAINTGVFLLLLAVNIAVLLSPARAMARSGPPITRVYTSLLDLDIATIAVAPDTSFSEGGGLVALDNDRVLLADAGGRLYVVSDLRDVPQVTPTGVRVPVNADQFEASRTPADFAFVRVTDLLLDKRDLRRIWLYASHLYWHEDENCVTLRVSRVPMETSGLGSEKAHWSQVFESSPCVPSTQPGQQTGGRMTIGPDGRLLLALGDFRQLRSLDSGKSSYGKILEIEPADGSVTVLSTGHRNPQGLTVTEDGTVWSTEHGPDGGDELNRIERGANYGWPQSTYGTEYGAKSWPLLTGPEPHSVGTKPILAWIPSPGVSNLIEAKGPAFSAWEGDLIVGTMIGSGGRSLIRVKVVEGRAILQERMEIGVPVRDLVQLPDGALVVWDGAERLLLIERAPATGLSPCVACHSVYSAGPGGGAAEGSGIGPLLVDIIGSAVAGQPRFQYSSGLRELGGRWTEDRLDAFLQDPEAFAPGTSMDYPGVESPEERREIIEALAAVRTDRR